MSDQTYDQNIQIGSLGDAKDVSNARTAIEQQRMRVYKFEKRLAAGTIIADAMAADATAETLGCRIPFVGIVRKIVFTPQEAIVGDAANHFTLTVSKRDAAGANLTTIGTVTSDSDSPGQGSFVAFVGENANLTNANVQVVAGGAITWSIAKGGAGVICPVFEVEVHVLDA